MFSSPGFQRGFLGSLALCHSCKAQAPNTTVQVSTRPFSPFPCKAVQERASQQKQGAA